jgi:hypothetical protein
MKTLKKLQENIMPEIQPLLRQRKALIRKNLLLRWSVFVACSIGIGIGSSMIFHLDANDNMYPICFVLGAVIGVICLLCTMNSQVEKKEKEIQAFVKSLLSPIIEKALNYYFETIDPLETTDHESEIESAIQQLIKMMDEAVFLYFDSSQIHFINSFDFINRFDRFNPVEVKLTTGTYFLIGIKLDCDDEYHYGDTLPITIQCSYRKNGVIEGTPINIIDKSKIIPIKINL